MLCNFYLFPTYENKYNHFDNISRYIRVKELAAEFTSQTSILCFGNKLKAYLQILRTTSLSTFSYTYVSEDKPVFFTLN